MTVHCDLSGLLSCTFNAVDVGFLAVGGRLFTIFQDNARRTATSWFSCSRGLVMQILLLFEILWLPKRTSDALAGIPDRERQRLAAWRIWIPPNKHGSPT